MRTALLAVLGLSLAVAACHGGQSAAGSSPSQGAGAGAVAAPEDRADTRPYNGIAADETVRFTGTEPFWGGSVAGTLLTYSTPDKPDGDAISVKRFAGRAGLSWSGTYRERPFTLAVTEGKCSDGMSDRTYPFTATLMVEGEQRDGCAWSDRRGVHDAPGEAAPAT